MEYYVYIIASVAKTLYVGVTRDLERRMNQHRLKTFPGFTSRYNVSRMVYYESTNDIREAIAREKEIKGWRRSKKTALVNAANPHWEELGAGPGTDGVEIPRRPSSE